MTWRVWASVGFVALGALLLGLDLADGRLDEDYPGFVGSIAGAWVPVIVIVRRITKRPLTASALGGRETLTPTGAVVAHAQRDTGGVAVARLDLDGKVLSDVVVSDAGPAAAPRPPRWCRRTEPLPCSTAGRRAMASRRSG